MLLINLNVRVSGVFAENPGQVTQLMQKNK